MVLVKHEAAGVVLRVEVHGKLSRVSLDLVGATREERDGAARSLAIFAEVLAARFARQRGTVES